MAPWLSRVTPKSWRPALSLAPPPRGAVSTWKSDFDARRTWDPVRGLELKLEINRDAKLFRILWRKKMVISFDTNVAREDRSSRMIWPDHVEWDVYRDSSIDLIGRDERRQTIVDALSSYQANNGILRFEDGKPIRGGVVVRFDLGFVGR